MGRPIFKRDRHFTSPQIQLSANVFGTLVTVDFSSHLLVFNDSLPHHDRDNDNDSSGGAGDG